MRNYFYKSLAKYISFYIPDTENLLIINPDEKRIVESLPNAKVYYINATKIEGIDEARVIKNEKELKKENFQYILLNSTIHLERDIQDFLNKVYLISHPDTRIIITYFSNVWRPFLKLATLLGLRRKTEESNWIAHEDLENLLILSSMEKVKRESKFLFPMHLLFIGEFINRFISPLPFFNLFNLVNILIARPIHSNNTLKKPSVSIVVPARNESGNIENILKRVPKMGPDDELIFVEGNSTDDTWEKILEITPKYKKKHKIIIAKQDGKGKGDAVRKGFSLATKEILMILDADLTVTPEDLPRFYEAISKGKGEFINGSRLVYPMEKEAMRFFNLLGNKFFALSFSFVLGQRFKDTLCGTKVLTRENYLRIVKNRSFFGDFDPFGDFDLLFGASRFCLKIIEVPITYRERTYGTTNISRWKHGSILLAMLLFAARKIKFL
ncbi:MAG: glycosyltransferase family 2 protein [Leptospiraceae bacterium]|nr:glycosyltransferase family 2 protein [Leptospiraceae bacterium]